MGKDPQHGPKHTSGAFHGPGPALRARRFHPSSPQWRTSHHPHCTESRKTKSRPQVNHHQHLSSGPAGAWDLGHCSPHKGPNRALHTRASHWTPCGALLHLTGRTMAALQAPSDTSQLPGAQNVGGCTVSCGLGAGDWLSAGGGFHLLKRGCTEAFFCVK